MLLLIRTFTFFDFSSNANCNFNKLIKFFNSFLLINTTCKSWTKVVARFLTMVRIALIQSSIFLSRRLCRVVLRDCSMWHRLFILSDTLAERNIALHHIFQFELKKSQLLPMTVIGSNVILNYTPAWYRLIIAPKYKCKDAFIHLDLESFRSIWIYFCS